MIKVSFLDESATLLIDIQMEKGPTPHLQSKKFKDGPPLRSLTY